MDLTLATVAALLRSTLTAPRETAARLLALDPPDDARWLGFVIVVVLSVLVGQASILVLGESAFGGSLIFMAVFQTMVLLGLVVAVQGIGRLAGGSGTFPDTLLLLAWLQFVMIAVQIVQILVLLLVPPLFGFVTMASLAIFMWLLVNFTMALHGFTSALKVTVGIVFAFFGLAVVLAIVLAILGLGPQGV
ncbi:YIP1 family protein [Roseibaca sp. V10]|uniref:YIP1 family protein n=1 Tax=Roseinatronobacter domitianus TaxID=2940293 RepID=A0ABT0M0M9_9RHOB|nr:YIP1 family protein [Roseibaca domitiana]MCL1628213.1 YIP1 family protein [Roseibaca domitiana]